MSKKTPVTFAFPDGQEVTYASANVILEEMTKEYMVEKRLFPYIPYYITRYEKELISGKGIERAVCDLEYFRDEMVRLHGEKELSDEEMLDLKGFMNTIITHITDGNQQEERLVKIMGGTVIETESEKLVRQGIRQGICQGIRQGMNEGEAKMLIEMGQEYGMDDGAILKRMQEKIGLSLEEAVSYLRQYGKRLV